MSQLMHSSAENGSPILLDREGTLQLRPYGLVSVKFVLLKSTSFGESVGARAQLVLPFIRTTDTLKAQILSYDILCH